MLAKNRLELGQANIGVCCEQAVISRSQEGKETQASFQLELGTECPEPQQFATILFLKGTWPYFLVILLVPLHPLATNGYLCLLVLLVTRHGDQPDMSPLYNLSVPVSSKVSVSLKTESDKPSSSSSLATKGASRWLECVDVTHPSFVLSVPSRSTGGVGFLDGTRGRAGHEAQILETSDFSLSDRLYRVSTWEICIFSSSSFLNIIS